MSISAASGIGIPGGKKGYPRRGTAPAEAPPPGVRENTRTTVTAAWSTILARIPRPLRRQSPELPRTVPFWRRVFLSPAGGLRFAGGPPFNRKNFTVQEMRI